MNSSYRYILILALLALPVASMARDDHYNVLFEQANLAYKSGAYDSAKNIYAEIAQNGMVSSDLFYNLGNAHFKLGNIPTAILFYERALRLAPNDDDIAYNLDIANSFTGDKIEALEPIFFVAWWRHLALSFTPDFWAITWLALLSLAAALFAAFALSRRIKTRQLGLLGGMVVLLLATTVYFLAHSAQKFIDKPEAIVFASSVSVKSEPGLNGTDQFVIHEGLKVEVLDTDGEWTRIKLADGNSGWLPNQSIELI